MDKNKRAILEAAAKAEKQLRPFERSIEGVSYEDIVDEFDISDFPVHPTMYIPARLRELYERDLPALDRVKESGASSSANYRLTEHGWDVVDETPP